MCIRDRVVGEIARNLVTLAQQFLSTEEVVGEVGQDGSSMAWTQITPEDLQQGMRFNYSVEMGSLAPADARTMKKDALELFQLLLPLQPLGLINVQKVVEDLLRAFGKTDPQSYFTQQQEPGALPGQDPSQPPVPQGAPPA